MFLLIFYFILQITGCEKVLKNGDTMKNNTKAIFHGGPDGGHFFELVESNNTKYRFKIYMDYNEKLYIEGYFTKCIDSCNFEFLNDKIHDFISNYNNDLIYLIDKNKKHCILRLSELIYQW
ncbi:hypothetical protein BH10BAC5_BH10BAC5_24480 [soil metagenome]